MGRASGDFGWGRKLEQCQGCDGVDLCAERDGRQIDEEIRVVIGKREGPSGSPRGGKHLGRRHAIEQENIRHILSGEGLLEIFGAHHCRKLRQHVLLSSSAFSEGLTRATRVIDYTGWGTLHGTSDLEFARDPSTGPCALRLT